MNLDALPKTRAEAKAVGAKYYYTGQPCKHGHIAPRKVKGVCLECMRAEHSKYKDRRAEYFAAYNKSDAGRAAKNKYYAANKDAVIARANAVPAEQRREWKRQHKLNNPEQQKAYTNLRRRRFREATPKWLTSDDKTVMRQMYLDAMQLTKATGERYVVDHIVPLQGESVSGLHVPWNLRVITQAENLRKSNKLLDTEVPACHNPSTGNPYLPA